MALGIFWNSVAERILKEPCVKAALADEEFLRLAEKEKFDFALAIEKSVDEEVKNHLKNTRKALKESLCNRAYYTDFVKPDRESLFDLIPQRVCEENLEIEEYFTEKWVRFEGWRYLGIQNAINGQLEYFKKEKDSE